MSRSVLPETSQGDSSKGGGSKTSVSRKEDQVRRRFWRVASRGEDRPEVSLQ